MPAPEGQTSTGVASRKSTLRAEVLGRLRGMPAEARQAAGEALAARVLDLDAVRSAATVAAYVGTGLELPTLPLLDALTGRGARVLLPVLLPDVSLAWGLYRGAGSLAPGPRGTLQPVRPDGSVDDGESLADADVVLVPGVAFDPGGGRLGRGGGSYDRALSEVSDGVPLVGVAAEECVVSDVPVEWHDVRVHLVVTPTRVLTCRWPS